MAGRAPGKVPACGMATVRRLVSRDVVVQANALHIDMMIPEEEPDKP